jgi:arylsulfatase A-like enzyme
MAGVEPPEHMDGVPFLGPNAGKRKYIYAARDRIDEVVDRIRCVRSKQHKYVRNFTPEQGYRVKRWSVEHNPTIGVARELHGQGKLTAEQSLLLAPQKPEEELYDVKNDPNEYDNLVHSPRHQRVLKEMRRLIEDWIERTNDAGRRREKREEALQTRWFDYDSVYH